MLANVPAYSTAVVSAGIRADLKRSREAPLFQSNDLPRSSFGDENALCKRVNPREQLDSRPNLILNFKFFSRTSRIVRLG